MDEFWAKIMSYFEGGWKLLCEQWYQVKIDDEGRPNVTTTGGSQRSG